jgi:signal transduction histidine kinase
VRSCDGHETVVSYNATTFYDRERRLQGVFAAARDVTERKRLDQALEEANVEFEGAKVRRGEGQPREVGLSLEHEPRAAQPLNAILGFAQLMESDAPPPPRTRKRASPKSSRPAGTCSKLINEILDLAQRSSPASSPSRSSRSR